MLDFDTVYREQRPIVRRWVAWRYDETLAEDVVQEAFLQAWLNWDQIDTVDNIRRWLIGIAKYTALHMSRSGRAMRRGGGAELVRWDAETDPRVDPSSPDMAMYVAQLRSHFGCLSPTQSEALTALAEGETPPEFGKRTGRSQQAVSEALRLGRKRLCKQLDDVSPFLMA